MISSPSNSSISSALNILQNKKEEAEIWIYSKTLEALSWARSSIKSDNNSNEEKAKSSKEAGSNDDISAFKHWILATVFQDGETLLMEAYKANGKLQARMLDSIPDGVKKYFLGKADVSREYMIDLYNKSKLVGEKYSIIGANCQTWIMGMLEALEFKGNFQTINDMMERFVDGVGATAVVCCVTGFGCATAHFCPPSVAIGLASASAVVSIGVEVSDKFGFCGSFDENDKVDSKSLKTPITTPITTPIPTPTHSPKIEKKTIPTPQP